MSALERSALEAEWEHEAHEAAAFAISGVLRGVHVRREATAAVGEVLASIVAQTFVLAGCRDEARRADYTFRGAGNGELIESPELQALVRKACARAARAVRQARAAQRGRKAWEAGEGAERASEAS